MNKENFDSIREELERESPGITKGLTPRQGPSNYNFPMLSEPLSDAEVVDLYEQLLARDQRRQKRMFARKKHEQEQLSTLDGALIHFLAVICYILTQKFPQEFESYEDAKTTIEMAYTSAKKDIFEPKRLLPKKLKQEEFTPSNFRGDFRLTENEIALHKALKESGSNKYHFDMGDEDRDYRMW